MKYPYFSKNGVVLPSEEASVPLACIEYTYGFGVYETLRVKNDRLVFAEDHISRLEISAKIIGLNHRFSAEFFLKALREFVEATRAGTYNVKVLLVGGRTPEEATIYIMGSSPMYTDRKFYKKGVHTITSHFERAFPHAKSLNMLQSYMAYKKAAEAGAYDALLVNRNGHITEGTRTNFFAIKDDVIFSAPEDEILLGVTRKNILEVAAMNGFSLQNAAIGKEDLTDYDGAFITSTSTKIMPLKSVDEMLLPPIPEKVKQLMKLFDDYLAVELSEQPAVAR